MSTATPSRLFCTIVSHSHLPFARALAESLREAGNPEPLFILVTDLTATEQAAEINLRLLTIEQLGESIPQAMLHYFDAFELCNALKPFLISHLLGNLGAQRLVYLDADIWVTGSFTDVWAALDDASLLLTPHHLAPPPLNLPNINEIEVVDLGFLNGGFAAWKAGAPADRILAWMTERLPVFGFCDRARCMFVDQKLLPLTLSYFPDDVRVLRDPGLNVAYWNAHERQVVKTTHWQTADRPVVFFHLSGYKLEHPDRICAYHLASVNAGMLAASPWFSEVITSYRALLLRHQSAHATRPYGYARLDGLSLNTPLRALLYRDGKIDRSTSRFWRIRFIEMLRLLKRKLIRFDF